MRCLISETLIINPFRLPAMKRNHCSGDTAITGKAMYNFGNPVFVQNQQYTFGVKAFEQYPYYESVLSDGY